jgi:hypothetical protein
MRHIQPEALRPFVGHPTLKRALVGLGSQRKNGAAESLLGLEKINRFDVFRFEEHTTTN